MQIYFKDFFDMFFKEKHTAFAPLPFSPLQRLVEDSKEPGWSRVEVRGGI